MVVTEGVKETIKDVLGTGSEPRMQHRLPGL